MISVSGLTKNYGSFAALGGISFDVQPGEICGFLGVNGAGKTTTLRILAGVLKPSAGSVAIGGYALAKDGLKAKAITGYIPDRPNIYPKLTGREFLEFVGDLYGMDPKVIAERIQTLLADYWLSEWQEELVESYSHGMRQRLALVAGLLHSPKVLLVDEPTVGLDPHGARLLKQRFREYAQSGVSILLSTHSLNVAEEIADRVLLIHQGRILAQGTVDDLRRESGLDEERLEEIFLRLTLDAMGED